MVFGRMQHLFQLALLIRISYGSGSEAEPEPKPREAEPQVAKTRKWEVNILTLKLNAVNEKRWNEKLVEAKQNTNKAEFQPFFQNKIEVTSFAELKKKVETQLESGAHVEYLALGNHSVGYLPYREDDFKSRGEHVYVIWAPNKGEPQVTEVNVKYNNPSHTDSTVALGPDIRQCSAVEAAINDLHNGDAIYSLAVAPGSTVLISGDTCDKDTPLQDSTWQSGDVIIVVWKIKIWTLKFDAVNEEGWKKQWEAAENNNRDKFAQISPATVGSAENLQGLKDEVRKQLIDGAHFELLVSKDDGTVKAPYLEESLNSRKPVYVIWAPKRAKPRKNTIQISESEAPETEKKRKKLLSGPSFVLFIWIPVFVGVVCIFVAMVSISRRLQPELAYEMTYY